MQQKPLSNKNRRQNASKIVYLIYQIFGSNANINEIERITDIIFWILQFLTFSAKIITRKRIGLGVAELLAFLFHLIGVTVFFLLTDGFNEAEMFSSTTIWFYAFIYLAILTILYILNFLGRNQKVSFEKSTNFRGYGILASRYIGKPKLENTTKWLRLTDPIILIFITWSLQKHMNPAFEPIAILLYVSSVILFIEEILYIYDDKQLDENMINAEQTGNYKSLNH